MEAAGYTVSVSQDTIIFILYSEDRGRRFLSEMYIFLPYHIISHPRRR
jgi:hypothetical protein